MAEKEYIERGALEERLKDFSEWCRDGRKQGVDFVLDCSLPNMPAADVVEVVRCKDCIHSKKYNYLEDKGMCMCERKIVRHGIYKNPIMLEVSKNDFCSGGERKEK